MTMHDWLLLASFLAMVLTPAMISGRCLRGSVARAEREREFEREQEPDREQYNNPCSQAVKAGRR